MNCINMTPIQKIILVCTLIPLTSAGAIGIVPVRMSLAGQPPGIDGTPGVHGGLEPQSGQIAGRVVDAVKDTPVVAATVQVEERLADRLPNGAIRLRSMEETILLPIKVRTDRSGAFIAALPLAATPSYFKLVVRASGYREMIDALVTVSSGSTTTILIELLPARLTSADSELLERKQLKKKQEQFEGRSTLQQQE
jgi:hypothetical protein